MKLPRQASGLGPSDAANRRETRVAFFGGSFDPPHNGHLAVARAARDAFALDVVLFAPVGMQPLKPEGPAASFEDRVAMSRLAIAGESGFQLSLADAPRSPDAPKSRPDRASAPNFTIDTLEWLRTSLVPDCALFCLMGADSFFALRRWHRGAELPFVAPLIVASRPGQPLQDLTSALPPGLALEPAPEVSLSASAIEVRTFVLMNQAGDRAPFFVLPNLHVDISASEIRAQIHAAPGGLAAERDLVPSAVREYIAQHGLYRS